MSLISIANMQSYCGHVGAVYDACVVAFATTATGAVAGNIQKLASNLLGLITGTLNDFTQQNDLGPASNTVLGNTPAEKVVNTIFAPVIRAIDQHCRINGSTVDSTIVSLDTYLKYYNGGSGGVIFANMVTHSFGLAYQSVFSTYLTTANGGTAATTYASVMSPGINPTNGNSLGMGTYNKATATFTAGASVTQSSTAGSLSYADVLPIAVITTALSGGAAHPLVTVTGTDHLGNTGQTWTGTYGENTPAATISQQTVSSGAIAAQARATVTVGSTTGIVPGSLVTINTGLSDSEVVLVEAVPSSTTFTAVFLKAHNASATVDGNYGLTLTNASSRRIRTVSAVSIATSTAGVIRIEGRQDLASI